jgi:hypothetical protein
LLLSKVALKQHESETTGRAGSRLRKRSLSTFRKIPNCCRESLFLCRNFWSLAAKLFAHFFPKAKCHNRKKSIMKTPLKLLITGLTLLTLSTLNSQLSTAFAQGALTPPGAPAPTMKTLAQIEPRIPISSAPFVITNGGSYYLTTNLTVNTGDAITIATNGVTLDLNGFTIASTASSATGYGIRLNSGLRDLAIFNGHIVGGVTNNGSGVYSGSGFLYGIYYSGSEPANTRVSGVSVSGCLYHGIYPGLNDSTVVESCTVRTVGSAGIIANTIRGSIARDCGGQAISGGIVSDSQGQSTGSLDCFAASVAQNCSGSCSGSGTGLYSYRAQNCSGSSSGSGIGLYADIAQNCSGYCSGSGTGLYAGDVAIGCVGSSSSGTGLQAIIANSCLVAHGTTNITHKYNMP